MRSLKKNIQGGGSWTKKTRIQKGIPKQVSVLTTFNFDIMSKDWPYQTSICESRVLYWDIVYGLSYQVYSLSY